MGLQYGAFMNDWTCVSEHEAPNYVFLPPCNAGTCQHHPRIETGRENGFTGYNFVALVGQKMPFGRTRVRGTADRQNEKFGTLKRMAGVEQSLS